VRRAFIGVSAQTAPLARRIALSAGIANSFGARIMAVEAGSPAAQAGLQAGDLVVAIDGEAVAGVDDMLRLLNSERIGREVTLAVLRRGKALPVALQPGERDPRRERDPNRSSRAGDKQPPSG
jgi:S1-C subfamily serine protease